MGPGKKKQPAPAVPPDVQTIGELSLEERNEAAELWEALKKSFAKSVITTKSSSEMRRVTEAARVKCNSILMLCRADGVTTVQREIRQFLQRSWT
tara:strand:- start:442 stop:726 length:285 start_codon:yes stop_codon:yes gene_type:complete